jgi:hypothetical protein
MDRTVSQSRCSRWELYFSTVLLTGKLTDGTQWEIKIQGNTIAVSASGDNAFPDDNDPEYADYEERYGYPRPFRRFLLAVRRLIGWLPFE